ncbi:mucin-19-like [Amphibalanus amphitrite]|uniref:mucin-19-like n=1 Tax=Amphibalanus amphitrite TaxID=1232801 RepID=UPI001C91CC51|nr:mucin-19-like [Amphibalanus amphitrite]
MEDGKAAEASMDEKSTCKLESMLKELVSYKHAGDMSEMSPEVQTLLRREEECQAREEARYAARRLKGRRPRERRRGRDADQSAAGRGHSLDNMAAESRAGTAESKTKGVAGRTAEGGSCFNLSRGSFEPALRRQRIQQAGGSLEDLSAIDESTTGLESAAKSGGSLQNLSQQADQPPAAEAAQSPDGTAAPTEQQAAPGRPDAAATVVIQMSGVGEDSDDDSAARLAVRALAAPCAAEEAPERGTSLRERPRHTLSLEEGGGALQATVAAVAAEVATAAARRQASSELEPKRKRSTAPTTIDRGVLRCVNAEDLPKAALLMARSCGQVQTLDGSAASTNSSTSSRHENGRRKNKKKVEPLVTTESVENYQGDKNVDYLIQFIESGGSKLTAPTEKNGRKAERAGRREVKGRRPAEERPGRQDRRIARRQAAKSAAAAPAAASRSSSVESQPAEEEGADQSRLSGDPAAGAAALWARDGVTYVSAAPAPAGDGFVRDFYSVTDETGVPEESEFHVVTRRQRRRPAARPSSGPALDTQHAPAGPPGWRPSRPGAASRQTHSARSVTNSEETSDADSDGAASAPAGRAPLPSDSGVASAASSNSASSSASSASSISSSSPGFSASSSAAASWADVAKPKPADATAQTDFIDGVGAIFGDRPPAHAGLLRGGAESLDSRVGSARREEFPAIAVAPVAPTAAVVAPASSPAPAAATVTPSESRVSTASSPVAPAVPAPTSAQTAVVAARVNGVTPSAAAAAAAAVVTRTKRSPVVEIPAAVLSGDGAAGPASIQKVADIQFGYIDTPRAEAASSPAEVEAPAAVPVPSPQTEQEPESKAAPPGVDGFCRRFRAQPVDVSQFNWKEVSVFLSKVYAEAVRVTGAPSSEPQRAQRL